MTNECPRLVEITPILPPPIQFSKTPARIRTGAAPCGQHTQEVLGQLGYSQQEIESLRQEEVII